MERVGPGNERDLMTDSDAAYQRLRCEFCSGRLHVVDRAGPTLECEDCGRKGMWDDSEKRVIPLSSPAA
jgi:hypothetical protein